MGAEAMIGYVGQVEFGAMLCSQIPLPVLKCFGRGNAR